MGNSHSAQNQGVLDFPENRIQVQRPSIWIFDLRTDTLIRRFEIPSNVVSDSKGIISLTVDANDKQCDDVYAYLPDINNYRLYVYRLVASHVVFTFFRH